MKFLIVFNMILVIMLIIFCFVLWKRKAFSAPSTPPVPPVQPVEPPKKAVSNLDTSYAGLDLSGTPRDTYRLVLRDGQIVYLRTPTKAVADSFERIGVLLQRIGCGRQSATEEQELYLLASKILSHNTAALQVDARKMMDDLTLAELTELLSDYMSWLTKVIESKN